MKARTPFPKALNEGEECFLFHCKQYGFFPAREYRFDPLRRWRFDFALVGPQIAVEVEGGVWKNGAHTRGRHFESDCAKYNRATMLGWRVLRFTPEMVKRGDAINAVLEMTLL
jgi:very-short-patch-repair endonuclease